MKTRRDWIDKWPDLEHIPEDVFDEIQRDAREGMVPAKDVFPLFMICEEVQASLPSRDIKEAIDSFRAKHPNLFTK